MSRNPEDELLDSDEDDEDFVPGAEEDDEPIPANSDDDDGVNETPSKKRKTAKSAKGKGKPASERPPIRKKRTGLQLSDEEDEDDTAQPTSEANKEVDDLWAALNNPKSAAATPAAASKPTEKTSEVDALWAALNKPSSSSSASASRTAAAKISGIPASWLKDTSAPTPAAAAPPVVEEKKVVTVEEKYDFAGETIVVKKEVELDLASPKKVGTASNLDSLLSDIKGKKKMSTLQKSALDWQSFRKDEGIESELDHQKKDGYLEKQAFLTRTDWRQFEQEKEVRNKARAQMQSQQKKH